MLLQRNSLYLFLNVIVVICAREPSSPICSKYDYEERLLERVLRNELALETTLNEILKTNAKVVDALKQLEDGKAKMEYTLAVMESKQITMESSLNDFIHNASNNINSTLTSNMGAMVKAASDIKANATVTVQQLVNEVHTLKVQLKVPSIYFHARIVTTLEVSDNQDVVFPSVEVNEGQGYDSSTGKFTSPVSGMYMFSVQNCVSYQKYVRIEIVHKGKTLQRSLQYDSVGVYPCVTMQVSATVAMGTQVWVRTTGTTNFYADSYRYNSFSGTLIHV